jgi:protein involved in polysaccharide export with SLBB domain
LSFEFEHNPVAKPIIILLLGLMFLHPYPGFAQKQEPKTTQNEVSSTPQTVGEKQDSPFHPGDGIEVTVFPDTSSLLNKVYPIDDQGYVLMPVAGKVQVSNISQDSLVNFILNKYKEYLRYPYVQVRPMMRVSVLGGVTNPGFYYIDPDRSLWDLIYETGGTLKEDGLKKMRWERSRKTVSDNLIPYLQNGSSLQHIGVKSGDQIWVPSPTARTWFDTVRDLLPVVTVLTSVWLIYWTYQRDQYRISNGQ